MKKIVIAAVALFLAAKFGWGYLVSEKFQRYSDQHPKPFFCTVNNTLGEFRMLLSQYKEAQRLFERNITRCPSSPAAENALFKIALSLEEQGRNSQAVDAYLRYIEAYPETKRAQIATKSVQILRGT